MIKETTEARIEFHERYWRNVGDGGKCASFIFGLSALVGHVTMSSFLVLLCASGAGVAAFSVGACRLHSSLLFLALFARWFGLRHRVDGSLRFIS